MHLAKYIFPAVLLIQQTMGLAQSKPIVYEELYMKSDEVNFAETPIMIRNAERNMAHWLPKDSTTKAIIIVAHGLDEHSLSHAGFGIHFAKKNFGVYAMDHYAHGKSGGKKGLIDDFRILPADFIEFVKKISSENKDKKIFIFAHSMGTLVTIISLKEIESMITAVIFSACALFAGPDSASPFGLRFLYPISQTSIAPALTNFLAYLDPNGPAGIVLYIIVLALVSI